MDLIFIALFVLVLILLSPFLILLSIFYYVLEKIDELRFRSYLAANNGKKYFCYTIREKSCDFVKTNILPFLPLETEVIFITDNGMNLGESQNFINNIIRRMVLLRKGFPQMAVISNGELIIAPINKEVYRAILSNRNADKILKKIQKFYAKSDAGSLRSKLLN